MYRLKTFFKGLAAVLLILIPSAVIISAACAICYAAVWVATWAGEATNVDPAVILLSVMALVWVVIQLYEIGRQVEKQGGIVRAVRTLLTGPPESARIES